MKKNIWIVIIAIFMIGIMVYGCSKKTENMTMDEIRDSVVAKLEIINDKVMYVDSEIYALRTFADLEIQTVPMESVDDEEDYLYRITFNPSEKVIGGNEIIVDFYKNYIQIGSEFYLPKDGVEYSSILDWVESKVEYFFE